MIAPDNVHSDRQKMPRYAYGASQAGGIFEDFPRFIFCCSQDVTNILPAQVLIPAWITSSFTEEVLFHSYPIERLTQLTGKRWLAALIAIVAFASLRFTEMVAHARLGSLFTGAAAS